ncbi:MAG: membrane dipeptidase [Thermomicrobiales bacterium]|nr:membrane dipeptidase [Thermomicrobiales bacterium]
MSERFGDWDFGLNTEQEERAARLHAESIIIDTLFQGPCGRRSFDDEMIRQLQDEYARHGDSKHSVMSCLKMPVRMAVDGDFPEFERCWKASGITAGNRQIDGDHVGESFEHFALAQAQFDRLPWLIKATTAGDIRRAKAKGKCAGFVSTQNTIDIGTDLNRLDQYYYMGMRMIQLTYNSVNFVAGGCTDRVDCGVTDFGVKFIKRMNELGMIVDISHCGRQTTLDACALSSAPVVASHTSADGLYRHDRAKSDEELRAIAASGGCIGVYLVSMFLSGKQVSTVEDFLDHVDYIANLVGPEFVGIGSDWPMQAPEWGVQRLAEWVLDIGFRPEHRVGALVNVQGFDDYRDFSNITRGLVSRGYSDDQIRGILGENFLRVFEHVCG